MILSQYAATIKIAAAVTVMAVCFAAGYKAADSAWKAKDAQRIAAEAKASLEAQKRQQSAIAKAEAKAVAAEEKQRVIYRTIYRTIHDVKADDCRSLPDDWLLIHNSAAAGDDTGTTDGAASEATASQVE